MKSINKKPYLIPIITSIIYLILSSCTCSKNLDKKCVLKEPQYQEFVKTHGLEEDINDFLYDNN